MIRLPALLYLGGWLLLAGLTVSLAPRIEPPPPPAEPLPTPAPADSSAAPEPVPADPRAERLVALLYPPPLTLGGPSPTPDDRVAERRLTAWLTACERSLASTPDDRIGALARWVGDLLTDRRGLIASPLDRPLEADRVARGWQLWAMAHGWPHAIQVELRRLWLAGEVSPPISLAVDDGHGRLGARLTLREAAAAPAGGWTRVTLADAPLTRTLYPPRGGQAPRLWVLGQVGESLRAIGSLELSGSRGGGALELRAPGGGAAGVIHLRWQRGER